MAKIRTRYVCQECGRASPRFLGRCPQCNSWNTMKEEIDAQPGIEQKPWRSSLRNSTPVSLKSYNKDKEEYRYPLPIGEFARVLGGGIVPGSLILVSGDPGIGKSTLLLQAAIELARQNRVLYVSGEESERQIMSRAVRLLGDHSGGEPNIPEDLFFVTETNLDVILDHISSQSPQILIVDSIQTIYMRDLSSSPGSVTQVRDCTTRFKELAKSSGLTIFLIGHVTKDGAIAGPRVLEHVVDTVLYLEGDRFQSYRLLRSIKNRFGATSEVGVFEMRDSGMIEVLNPSEAFLAERMVDSPGSAIAVTMEGTRPLLVEIQGLTSYTTFGNPRRTPNGVDFNRLLLIVAVLSRRIGIVLSDQDVFINVVGGLRISEPAADLAMAAAIASSYKDLPLKPDLALIGEVGLSGELRLVSQMQNRLLEAQKLGFRRAIIPKRLNTSTPWQTEIQVIEARSLGEAIKQALSHAK